MDLALRIVVAAVLAAAGTTKLRRGAPFADALAGHGVPRRLREPARVALALTELALSALLVSGVTDRAAGIAVAALGVLFTAVLVRARLRGTRQSACGCFGGRRTASTSLLAGRAALLALAGVAIAAGLLDVAPPDVGWQPVAIALLAVMVLLLSAAVLALYRQVGVLSLRLGPRTALELEDEGPPIGQAAPVLPGLARRGAELVAFLSTGCRICLEILPGLRALEREGVPIHWVREETGEEAFTAWAVPGTPYVVHVVDGVVAAKGLVNSLEQIDWVIDLGTERSRRAA